jgi:hypothetical protein
MQFYQIKNMSEHAVLVEPKEREMDCFVCEAGCVHFQYGYLLLNFSQEKFFEIVELFEEVRKEILQDNRIKDWSSEIIIEKEL